MTKMQYQRYSPEFKIHALKRASEDGVTDKDICEELGIVGSMGVSTSPGQTQLTRIPSGP